MAPAQTVGRREDVVGHLAVGRDDVGDGTAVKGDDRQRWIGRADGRGADREDGIALGSETQIIDVAWPNRRHSESVGAGQIIGAIRPEVFEVRSPIFVVGWIDSDAVAGWDSVADVQYHIAGLLVERDQPIGGQLAGHLDPVIAPVTTCYSLIGRDARKEIKILDIAS